MINQAADRFGKTVFLLCLIAGTATAGETSEEKIARAMSAAPAGAGVSNSNPAHPDPQSAEDYVETGPHLMIVVPKAMLEGITDDPNAGGPYVMWGETPYAHIMVPVALEGKGVVTGSASSAE